MAFLLGRANGSSFLPRLAVEQQQLQLHLSPKHWGASAVTGMGSMSMVRSEHCTSFFLPVFSGLSNTPCFRSTPISLL